MSKSLLFVDDSATMQTVAEITFRGSDWEFAGARNAADARSAASGKSMILVDAVMPDGSGYDLAKELGAANPDAVVLMVCGNSEAYDEGKGSAAGCAGHIIKPWQTDKIVEQLAELDQAGPRAAPSAAAAPAPVASAVPVPVARSSEPSAPRSATLMGMPVLEMPPSKPLPAGVAAIKPSKPAIPDLKPAALKPVATPPPPTPAMPAIAAAPAKAAAPALRAPMVSQQPGKPIRLVLASQAEAAAKQSAQASGLDGAQADALGAVSRELLEKIIWEVVPDLAEAIIRENLDTLTAKAR